MEEIENLLCDEKGKRRGMSAVLYTFQSLTIPAVHRNSYVASLGLEICEEHYSRASLRHWWFDILEHKFWFVQKDWRRDDHHV
jgi:hypothetical protein